MAAASGLMLQPAVIEKAPREFQAHTTHRSVRTRIDRATHETELTEVIAT